MCDMMIIQSCKRKARDSAISAGFGCNYNTTNIACRACIYLCLNIFTSVSLSLSLSLSLSFHCHWLYL